MEEARSETTKRHGYPNGKGFVNCNCDEESESRGLLTKVLAVAVGYRRRFPVEDPLFPSQRCGRCRLPSDAKFHPPTFALETHVHEAAWPLASWEVFYLIVGTAAGALIGLQFVVIVLGADLGALGGTAAIRAFATPTIVHFSAVMLVSALVSVPWTSPAGVAITVGASGLVGVLYGFAVVRQARRQTSYTPVLEDWVWHGALPVVSYAALLAAAIVFSQRTVLGLYVIGAAVLLLLFVGIHNAWDAVIYLARGRVEAGEASHQPPPAEK